MSPTSIEDLARQAVAGDRLAVAALVRQLQPGVYGLALRMLWRREEAEDATQEILVKVVTRLAQFDSRSSLRTWVYRVATNYLLDVKKSCVERQQMSFASFGDDLADGLSLDGPTDGERSVLVEEVRIGCTFAMLQCLDRPHRIAYILGEILDIPASEAADATEVDAATFRKRLQRARELVEAFTRRHCGLVSDEAACRCNRRVEAAVRAGRVTPGAPSFARTAASFVEARALIRKVRELSRAAEVHRASNPQDSGHDYARRVLAALEPFAD
ncbi:MAG: RNA polymerase sigma factor [Polyangiaceae bacterium]|nr:RNA polymerase sigma factor [Polyangiaceae bacterium]